MFDCRQSQGFQAMCMNTCLSRSYMKYWSWLGLSIEVVYFFHIAQAQDTEDSNKQQGPLPTPSTGVIISVLTVIFCVTCLLLVYAKFCRSNPAAPNHVRRRQTLGGLVRSQSGLSGIDKTIIESLPFFKFSSIRGSKEGLECAICISKFEDEETLRMLPKCKHAFHMKCIDQWLASHSSCPLCRYKVDPGDLKSFRYSFSSRLLGIPSNLSDDLNVDIFVQRELGNHQESSRFGSSFRNMHKSKELEEVLIGNQGNTSCDDNGNWKLWDKFNHKIVISGVVTRSRWSDLNSSDLLSLKSEMLMDASGKKFSNLESINSRNFHDTNDDEVDWRRLCESKFNQTDTRDENSASALNPAEKRSISEITHVSRFVGTSTRSRSIYEVTEKNEKEERLRRIWLTLARGTIQLFAGRQGRLQDQKLKRPVSFV